ncbi:heavy metal sensor histidine kinase [Chitinimonas sp. BJYL2]|uniref:heavy metal sensor histidine kinase n=1 Tax=Chitinimonas sp. BJYL2 TaxID=2976696 RepID=UPI0022B37080|nr:heavy metal sensor histidine kinase [Chitinimonas sp. BJYL2]
MRWRCDTGSLAFRLVALFSLGSALIMLGVGYTLYHALVMEVEARDLAEINGKTEVVQHILNGIPRADQLASHADQFAEIGVGHPHLSIGIRTGNIWLLRPAAEVANATGRIGDLPADQIKVLNLDGQRWWLRRVHHQWQSPAPADIDVLVAVDVSVSQQLLRQHRNVAMLVGLLGTLLSAALAYGVARRSLLPLGLLATQAGQLTAARLGAPLDIAQAPTEVRGLVASLNGMLTRLHDSFRSLEQFSADIAHELRTPLNNLMVQTQVTLSRPREAEGYVDALHSNLEELERLQRMVTDMLFLARADRGLLSVAPHPVNLRQEIDSVVEYFELAASERQQQITVTGELTVLGDRLMLRRVLTNLLSNAVRYAPAGTGIAVALATPPGEPPSFTISNRVEQLQHSELTHLFARFARGAEACRRDTDGVGLGLAIVDSIMRLHQGSVAVQLAGEDIRFTLHFAA